MIKNHNHVKQQFNFNPFGGIKDEELMAIIVPRIDDAFIKEIIFTKTFDIIELVGQKGRGKTTHLKYLSELLLNASIFYLNGNDKKEDLFNAPSDILLIDSIHHLSFFDRMKLFKSKKHLILTAHGSYKWEYRFAQKQFLRINFGGINPELLKELLNKRIALALKKNSQIIRIADHKVDDLIRMYKDDYRAILNRLYDLHKTAEINEIYC